MAGPIPNIEFLGASYDIVRMDPLSLASSAKASSLFDLSETQPYRTSIGDLDVPKGVSHSTILKTDYDSVSGVISSVAEFQDTLKQSVEANAGVDGAFEFSGSASYKNIKKETQNRKHSFVYARATAQLHGLSVDLKDAGSGLKLAPNLRRAVAQLPTTVSSATAGD